MTSYLYLNDVEAGGGTKFGGLGLTVMPKRGRALFWPSVLNDSPHEKDPRTNHEGTAHKSLFLFFSQFIIYVSHIKTFPFFVLQLYLLRLELSLEQMAGFINMTSRYVISLM